MHSLVRNFLAQEPMEPIANQIARQVYEQELEEQMAGPAVAREPLSPPSTLPVRNEQEADFPRNYRYPCHNYWADRNETGEFSRQQEPLTPPSTVPDPGPDPCDDELVVNSIRGVTRNECPCEGGDGAGDQRLLLVPRSF